MPNHYVGDLLHTIGISGLSRVRTELLHLAIVQTLAPHPVQMHRQLSRHRNLGDLTSTPHGEVKERVLRHSGWLIPIVPGSVRRYFLLTPPEVLIPK